MVLQPSDESAVGVGGPDTLSVLTTRMDGSCVALGLGSVLEPAVLTTGGCDAVSTCGFMGDVATGSVSSTPGEDKHCGEAALVTTALVTVWLGSEDSLAFGS